MISTDSRSGCAGPDQPRWIRRLTRLFPGLSAHILYRWSVTQALNVTQQLNRGVRYFDFRLVATLDKRKVFKNEQASSEYRVLHCLTGSEIMEVLKLIVTWLHEHSGEVVILDFQHFFKFSHEDHIRLVNMLVTLFGDLLCPWQQDLTTLTLTNMVTAGTRVIMVYPALFSSQSRAGGSRAFMKYFWPRSLCPNPWADTMDPAYLERFLTDGLGSHRSSGQRTLFVSQGVLTPSWRTVLRHPLAGVRQSCACACEDKVVNWLSEEQEQPNIVMTDFVSDAVMNKIIDRNR